MSVASRLPSLNAFSTSPMSLRPASAAIFVPGAGLPLVPWHGAQLAAMERTPASLRLGAAKFGAGGAGCCARALVTRTRAVTAARFLMEEYLGSLWRATDGARPRGRARQKRR